MLITARNELFLPNTVDDVLTNIRGNTDVIVSLDGPGNPSLPEHPNLTILSQPTVIGQRAGINTCATASTAKYIMKLDAHCSVDEGFDVKLVAPYESGEIDQNTTTIARMYNLHCFDWQCQSCGERTYQGPKPTKCAKCHKESFEMAMVWKPRLSRRTDFARFDRELHFQYWRSYEHRPSATGDIADVMSSVGACWMMPRQRFFDIDGLDERHGSWGQMGTEIACKSWLSGGRQIVNKRAWFSHMFRTQPGWSFPYPNPGVGARAYSQDLWRNGKWPKAKLPLDWLIEKFKPIPDWHEQTSPAAPAILTEQNLTKGIIYYSDCLPDPRILKACQNQILKGTNGHKVVSVTLRPIDFGTNYTLDLERGILTMFRQILKGLECCETDIVFLCEHDVLYHPSHFDFVPCKKDVYFYNENTWHVDFTTGTSAFWICKQVAGLCAYRDLLLEHYRKRVDHVAANGFSRRCGFEPGTHKPPNGLDSYKAISWRSAFPNIDIRHGKNLTPSKWRREDFHDQRNCQGWEMADEVQGWGRTKGPGIFEQMVTHIANGG